jgi:hypothetical protein
MTVGSRMYCATILLHSKSITIFNLGKFFWGVVRECCAGVLCECCAGSWVLCRGDSGKGGGRGELNKNKNVGASIDVSGFMCIHVSGTPMDIHFDTHSFQWHSMDINGYAWVSMDTRLLPSLPPSHRSHFSPLTLPHPPTAPQQLPSQPPTLSLSHLPTPPYLSRTRLSIRPATHPIELDSSPTFLIQLWRL